MRCVAQPASAPKSRSHLCRIPRCARFHRSLDAVQLATERRQTCLRERRSLAFETAVLGPALYDR